MIVELFHLFDLNLNLMVYFLYIALLSKSKLLLLQSYHIIVSYDKEIK